MTQQQAGHGQVVVASGDETLVEEVHRLAAGVGVVPMVTDQPAVAARWWQDAALVLVGADLAGPITLVAPGRRAGVLVLAREAEAADFRHAVDLGAESVLELPMAADWLSGTLADVADPRTPGLTVAVLGGSGGAGASLLAAALAQAVSWQGPSLLVDLDPWGPGADWTFGLERSEGVRWENLEATGRLGGGMLRSALPRSGRLGVLTWADRPVREQAMPVRTVLDASRRGHDLVVVDLPRRPGPAVEEALLRADRVLLVVLPTLAGIVSASAVSEALGCRPWVVVRGRGVDLAQVEEVLGPVIAEVPEQRGVGEATALGLGPLRSPRTALAKSVLGLVEDLGVVSVLDGPR